MSGAMGSSCRRSAAWVVCSDQRQRRAHLAGLQGQQALKGARVAHGGEHQLLVADAAQRAQQLDGFEHVVQVVGRLAHAHEHHLGHRPALAGQHHLGHDLGAAQLADQPALSGHAKAAAHGAAQLAAHAQATARQQYGFHRLPIGQLHQQALAVFGRVGAGHAGQGVEIGHDLRQLGAHGLGQPVFGLAAAVVLRQRARPVAQQPLHVHGAGAQGLQA